MKTLPLSLLLSFMPLVAISSDAMAQAQASCACYCGIWIDPPCSDNACLSACGGSGQVSSPSGPPSIAWGGMTRRAFYKIDECGDKAGCVVVRSLVMVPIGLIFDVPYYAVMGVGYGLYYGGVGVGRGLTAAGSAIASPFRSDPKALAAASAPVACGGSSTTFEQYREWEQCKRAILKRQKALTKLNSANADNERWCKGHVPLAESPNRAPWEERCNPTSAAPVSAPQPPSQPTAQPQSPSNIGTSVPTTLQNAGSGLNSGGFDGSAPSR